MTKTNNMTCPEFEQLLISAAGGFADPAIGIAIGAKPLKEAGAYPEGNGIVLFMDDGETFLVSIHRINQRPNFIDLPR